MIEKQPQSIPPLHETDATTRRRRKHVAEARATAQREKLDAQTEARVQQAREKAVPPPSKKPKGKRSRRDLLASRPASTTMESTMMVEWANQFDATIYLHEADQQWVMRPDPRIVFWSGETRQIGDDVTLVRLGGHFSGSAARF